MFPEIRPETLLALGLFLLAFGICCWYEEYTKNKNKMIAFKLKFEKHQKKLNKQVRE